MQIIIKNGTKHFVPHYNRTTGRYYGDKQEYLSDLKSRGLEPYDPRNVKTREHKKYKPSEWARNIVRAAERNPDSSCVRKEIDRNMKIKAVPKELRGIPKSPKGGWF